MMKTPLKWLQSGFEYFTSSIRHKIIVPYALLTLVLALFGVFVVTQLVAGSFEDRLNRQLVDAGRVVSDELVNREEERLTIERHIANTEGFAAAVVARDAKKLKDLVLPIIYNNKANIDSIIILDAQGKELLRVQRGALAEMFETNENSGVPYDWPEVTMILSDPRYEKETLLVQDAETGERFVYTVGPVGTPQGKVGAVLIGAYLQKEIAILSEVAVTNLTLFDHQAKVLASTLTLEAGPAEGAQLFPEFTPARYREVLANREVTLMDTVVARGQTYRMGYAPFVLRGQVKGVYGVALTTNFMTETNTWTRNLLAGIFSAGVVLVILVGYLVAQRIIHPLIHLVRTAQAITRGDFGLRTGLVRADEIGILAGAFDQMTAELQHHLKMREEEASKLNAILTSIADGVIVQDMEGQTLIMNPAAERIITTVGDHPVQQGAVADEQAPPARLLEHLAQLGFHQQERFDIEGLRMSLSALSAPVIAADETQLGAVIVVRDITREVESDRLKDDFITSASHELRTPLTAIKGYNQLLEMTGASTMDERQKGFVKEIERNVDDLLKIIQQMLDLSQIDAGVLGVDQEPVNLTELIAMETDEWLMKLEEKELSFDLTMPDKEIWVVGDAERLGMMVDNLLSNSYNYTHSGGQVQVLVTEENGRVRVDVKDTGVGITPEDQGRLFTRFVRAIHEDSTFGETSGAGLGLYISKAIAEAHQGEMWLEQSEVHGGSVFSFALPTIDPDTYEEPAWES